MTVTSPLCTDPVILNQWHVISALDEIAVGTVNETQLLDEWVSFTRDPDGRCRAWRSHPSLPTGSAVGAAGSGVGAVGSGVGAVGSGVGAVGSGVGAVGSGVGAVGSGVGAVGSGVGAAGSGVGAAGSGVGAAGSVGVAAALPPAEALPVMPEYGYLWTSLGTPPDRLFPLPEYHHPKRRNMNAGSIGVATSAPRAVENFLDLAHFPYVHDGSLGTLPHTEVVEYDVEILDGEVHATKCDFLVPKVGVNFDDPVAMRYRYRVPHPFCVMLYYDSLPDPSLEDICAIWVQPMSADRVRAHNYMGVIDDTSTDTQIKDYQLLIFAQDKPILENQHPRLLPLDPRAETPIRADRSAIAYRRWLHDLGVTYGVIPSSG